MSLEDDQSFTNKTIRDLRDFQTHRAYAWIYCNTLELINNLEYYLKDNPGDQEAIDALTVGYEYLLAAEQISLYHRTAIAS